MMQPPTESHPIFTDPLFTRSVSFDLSTSNVSPGDLYDGLGFGPATASGYGVNYSIAPDSIRYCVTCKREPGDDEKAAKFGDTIADTLHLLLSLTTHNVESKL
jgi:carnitine O-acetyltransferase